MTDEDKKYRAALNEYGLDWERRFPGFYRTEFWDLFFELYEREGITPINITYAIDLLGRRGKSLSDKAWNTYLKRAIDNGWVIRKRPKGQRNADILASEKLLTEMKNHIHLTKARFREVFS
jgi:hypothetical protein